MSEENKIVTLASIAGKVEEMMFAAAKVHQDRGRIEYKADMHRSAVGYAMAKAFADGLPMTAGNLVGLLAMLDNHSAWRQRFEKKGIFPKASERPKAALVDDYLAELSEEGV